MACLTVTEDIHILSPIDNLHYEKSGQAKYHKNCSDGNAEADKLVLGAVVPYEAMNRGPVCKISGPLAVVCGGNIHFLINPMEAKCKLGEKEVVPLTY